MKTFRCILGYPFGLIAETFARLTLIVSNNELNVNFDYLKGWKCTK